jgi:hypothetical protein
MILQNQHLFAHNGIKGGIKPFSLQLLLKIFHYVHFMLRLVFPGNSRESRDQAEKFPVSREWQSPGNRQALMLIILFLLPQRANTKYRVPYTCTSRLIASLQ